MNNQFLTISLSSLAAMSIKYPAATVLSVMASLFIISNQLYIMRRNVQKDHEGNWKKYLKSYVPKWRQTKRIGKR